MSPAPPVEFICDGREIAIPHAGFFARESPAYFTDTPATVLREIIAQIEGGHAWRAVVANAYATSNPWLHRIICDPTRDRFFREILPCSGQHILDVGSGWGQQALTLARDNHVCAIEPTPERLAFVRAVARQTGLEQRICFLQANANDLTFRTQFDVVSCIGVLEWAGTFAGFTDPQQAQKIFLQRLRAATKPSGVCVIGIENRLGLKYLLGSRDDHTGFANVSVLDYHQADLRWRALKGGSLTAITYTMSEYEQLIRQAGFSSVSFYCAYPDYKLPQTILPASNGSVDEFFRDGGFVAEHDGFDGASLPPAMQDTLRSHYASFAKLGIAAIFAPSYYIIARV